MEFVMIGALGLVILAGIGATIYSSMGGGSSEIGPTADLHFKCTNPECGKEHTKSHEEMSSGGPDGAMMMEEMGIMQVDCPHCKTPKSCLIMTKCPECGTFYLGESTKQLAEQMAAGGDAVAAPPAEPVRDVCPKCGTDRMEWYRKKYKQRKGKK